MSFCVSALPAVCLGVSCVLLRARNAAILGDDQWRVNSMSTLICDALSHLTCKQKFLWGDTLGHFSKYRLQQTKASLLSLAGECCLQTGGVWLLYAAPVETKEASHNFFAVALQFRRQIKFAARELITLV